MRVVACLGFLAAVAGCKDQNAVPWSNVYFPPSGVSYKNQVQPLFNDACATSGCHDHAGARDTTSRRPELTSYSSVISYVSKFYQNEALISCKPDHSEGYPDKSLLIHVVTGWTGYQRMPPYGSMLNDNQQFGLETWISEGAKNN